MGEMSVSLMSRNPYLTNDCCRAVQCSDYLTMLEMLNTTSYKLSSHLIVQRYLPLTAISIAHTPSAR